MSLDSTSPFYGFRELNTRDGKYVVKEQSLDLKVPFLLPAAPTPQTPCPGTQTPSPQNPLLHDQGEADELMKTPRCPLNRDKLFFKRDRLIFSTSS